MFRRQLKNIKFTFLSSEEILEQSVVEIMHGKIPSNASLPDYPLDGTLYDPKMGTIEKGKLCATCSMDFTRCTGHFGHIVLATPIVNPVAKKQFKWAAQHICRSCGRVMITSEHLRLQGIKSYKTNSKYIEKVACCFHCSQPKEPFDVETELEELKAKLEGLCKEDVRVLNMKGCHPKDLILQNFPIIPTCARPYLSNKDGSFDDDLTCQLSDIIKVNSAIGKTLITGIKPTLKEIQKLDFKITTYFDNNKKKSRHSASGHAYVGIKGLLGRKQGLIRKYLSGKRANQGSRTVIGGDTTLKIDEVGVPLEVCKILTKPLTVNSLNFELISGFMRDKKVNYLQKGDRKISLKFCTPQLEIGDKAHVQLMKGDWVVMNRQPSLHKPSIMGFKVVPQPVKTFKINLSVTKPFNADFDGDEVNMHVPQNPMAIAEVKELMATPNHILSPKNGKPIICLVQDAIVSMSLMTERKTAFDRDMFDQFLVDIEDLSRYGEIVGKLGRTGKALFSFLLPRDLHFTTGKVIIKRGLLLEGVANKSILGDSSSSLLKCLFDDYGAERAGRFIDECQFLSNRYMLYTGYSIGIEDCVSIPRSVIEKVVKDSLPDDVDKLPEPVLLALLNNVKNKVMSMAKQKLHSQRKNGFLISTESGAKGSLFNVCQMAGMLAQQCINGERLKPVDTGVPAGVRERGFVLGSFGTGLTPKEFFSHAQSGRTSLCDTGLTTSQTGYSQRRLIKLLERLVIQNDGSVRCCYTGKKYETYFGTDGVDPSRKGVDKMWLTRAIYRLSHSV